MHITVKYCIAFTPKCFVLAVAAISAKLRAIFLNIVAKFHNFCIVNSAHNGQFCPHWPILHKILCAQNRRILINK